MTTAEITMPGLSASGVANLAIECLSKPALVTADVVQAAQTKTDELFASLVMAKNDWQYAAKDQDAKYERLLRIKAEYTEWRALALRLDELLHEKQHGRSQSDAASGPSVMSIDMDQKPRRTGT